MRIALAIAAPLLIAAASEPGMPASTVLLLVAGVAALVFIRGVMLRKRVDRRRRRRGDDGDGGGDGWSGDSDGDGGGDGGGGGD